MRLPPPPPAPDIEISTEIREGGRSLPKPTLPNPNRPSVDTWRIADWFFGQPFLVVMALVLVALPILALMLAWSIYLIGSLGIPFDQICRLWPPGWKCP